MQIINEFSDIADQFDAVLCDVWGVIHNGKRLYDGVKAPLVQFKQAGKPVILLTNAPRPPQDVKIQVGGMGLDTDCYDDIVTSGYVTQTLIDDLGDKPIFHLGPERDRSLLQKQLGQLTALEEAKAVVCTGLFDDTYETPDHYNEMLSDIAERQLPFITANPDLVVDRNGTMIYCAGALAKRLSELGGKPILSGKPYSAVYEKSLEVIAEQAGKDIPKEKILCIGDGLMTDVKGALDNDFPCLFVFGGIHKADILPNGSYSEAGAQSLFAEIGRIPDFGIESLI